MSDHGLGCLSVGCVMQAERLGAVVQTKQVAREKHKRKKKVEGQQRRRAKDAADKEMLRRKTTAGTRNLEELSEEECAYTFSPRSADLLAPQKDYSESVSEGTLRPSSVGMFLHETKWPQGVAYRQLSKYCRLEEVERRMDPSDRSALARVRHEMDQAHLLEGKGLRDIHFGMVHNIKQYIIEQTRGLQEAADVSVMPSPSEMDLEEANSEESLSADAASALAFLSTMEPPSATVKQELPEPVQQEKPKLPLLGHDMPANDLAVPLQHAFVMIGTANFGDVLILMSVNSSDNPSLCLFSLKEPAPGDTVTTRRQFVLLEDFLAGLEVEDSAALCCSVTRVAEQEQRPTAKNEPEETKMTEADAAEESGGGKEKVTKKRKREEAEPTPEVKPPLLKKPRLEDDDEEEEEDQPEAPAQAELPAAEETAEVQEAPGDAPPPAVVYALNINEDVAKSVKSVNITALRVEGSESESSAEERGRLDFYIPNPAKGMALVDTVPFAMLRGLVSLNLAECNLVRLPASLANLPKLEYLYLSRNRIVSLTAGADDGCLPDALRLLDVSRNSISCLDLPELPQLRYLKASNNDISQLGESFGMLMASLEHLDLQRNRLEVFPVTLCCCVSLSCLLLNDNRIEFLPPELGLAMPNLELLDISRNKIITTAGLESATKLRIIRAGQNQISQLPNWSEMLMSLTELTVLDLNQNQIIGTALRASTLAIGSSDTSADLPPIDTHYQLECLSLRKNPLHFLPMRYYQLPMLRRLDLRGVPIGVLPPEVGCLNSLTSLLLRDTGIKALPPQIANLSLLTELDLGYNHMGHIPDCVFECENLRSLELLYNSITNLPESIGRLGKLMYLDVSRNKLEQLPSSLKKLSELRQLDVSCNKLSQIAVFTKELPNLKFCNFTYNKLPREEKNALKKRFAL